MKLDRKQAARAYRAVRLVKSGSSIALRHGVGRAGTKVALKAFGKVNVILAVADAVVSVAEAVEAWNGWQQAVEETAQLRAALRTSRLALTREVEVLRLAVKQEIRDLEDQRAACEKLEVVRKALGATLSAVQRSLDRWRDTPGDPAEFQRLARMYEDASRQYLQFLDELES